MGNKLVNVAATEAHPPLASAMKKFGRTWHSLADLDQAQVWLAQSKAYILAHRHFRPLANALSWQIHWDTKA
jgi:hypothetical protein